MKTTDVNEGKQGKNMRSIIVENFWTLVSGLLLFCIAVLMLFLFENYTVKKLTAMEEVRDEVVSVSPGKIDAANEGKMVLVSGNVTIRLPISDSVFGISTNALWLKRRVEMFQWDQKVTTSKKRKTYTYSTIWSEKLIDSTMFRKSEKYRNPESMPYQSSSFWSKTATLGAFSISDSLLDQIGNYQEFPLQNLGQVPEPIKSRAKLYQGKLYLSANPTAPVIGDIRVSYRVVLPQQMTIVSTQSGSSFKPYMTKIGEPFEMGRTGIFDVKTIFKNEKKANIILVWGFRVFSLIINLIGLILLFKVFRKMEINIPFITELVKTRSFFVTTLVSLSITVLITGIAWILYRPLGGLVWLAVSIGLYFIMRTKVIKMQLA